MRSKVLIDLDLNLDRTHPNALCLSLHPEVFRSDRPPTSVVHKSAALVSSSLSCRGSRLKINNFDYLPRGTYHHRTM